MITVTVGEQETQEPKPFPKLMVDVDDDGYIFYFVREGYGLPLTGSDWGYSKPDFANFSRHKFKDFNESITLKNK